MNAIDEMKKRIEETREELNKLVLTEKFEILTGEILTAEFENLTASGSVSVAVFLCLWAWL